MRQRQVVIFVSLLAFILSLLVGGILILINGDNPIVAYASLLKGAFSTPDNIANTLATSTQLIFTGLSVAVAFKNGFANIGAEGQLYLGAMAAAVVGIFAPLPGPMLLPMAIIMSFLVGGLYGMLPAVLRIKTGTNEVVTTLMLNYVAILFTSYLVNYPLKAPGAPIGMTNNIQTAAKLPVLYHGTRFNLGFLIAILAAILVYFYFKNTVRGYEMRLSGQNSEFASYLGIHVDKNIILSMFISGGLAGLGGAALVLGIQYRFVQGISPGYGFDGLTIGLMANFNALAVIPFAILFGAMRSGSLTMELLTNIPSELSSVIQALVILFMSSENSVTKYFKDFLEKRESIRKQKMKVKGGVDNV
ncbi:MAG: ABC transporter permease [Tissierellaceae bacterium]